MNRGDFPWSGFAKVIAKIYESRDIEDIAGERIAECTYRAESVAAVSIAAMNSTVFALPIALSDGEGCEDAVRSICEARGMTFLAACQLGEFDECLVVVAGCGLTNKAAIESLWNEIGATISDPPTVASLEAMAGERAPSRNASKREFWNQLARYFARMSRDHGLSICGDILTSDDADALDSADLCDPDASEDLMTGSIVRIGSGPSWHVVADPTPPPSAGSKELDAETVFASLESLDCTAFSFSYEPGAAGDFEGAALAVCQRYDLQLLGVCFMGETLECLAVVHGTREETEDKIVQLWEKTESDPEWFDQFEYLAPPV